MIPDATIRGTLKLFGMLPKKQVRYQKPRRRAKQVAPAPSASPASIIAAKDREIEGYKATIAGLKFRIKNIEAQRK